VGQFNLLVALPRMLDTCCDIAVAVDRQVYPHMRRDGKPDGPLDYYRVAYEHGPDSRALAFINVGGHWQSRLHEDELDADGELGRMIPAEEWKEEVDDWLEFTKRHNMVVLVCVCHD
jgi:hypothetical protein